MDNIVTYSIGRFPDQLQFVDVEVVVLSDIDKVDHELIIVDEIFLWRSGIVRPVAHTLVLPHTHIHRHRHYGCPP